MLTLTKRSIITKNLEECTLRVHRKTRDFLKLAEMFYWCVDPERLHMGIVEVVVLKTPDVCAIGRISGKATRALEIWCQFPSAFADPCISRQVLRGTLYRVA